MKNIGNYTFVETNSGTFALGFDNNMSSILLHPTDRIESNRTQVLGVDIVSWGRNNDLPTKIRTMLEKNNLAPGILERKSGLMWGQGPELYTKVYENNSVGRAWCEVKEIKSWLSTWDYRQHLRDAMWEYLYMNSHFAKFFATKGSRIGVPKIAKIETTKSVKTRLGWAPTKDLSDVRHIYTGDFEDTGIGVPLRKYSIFNRQNIAGVKMGYFKHPTFGRHFYSFPSFIGTLPWIKNANDIPEIIAYLTENMIAAAYHVRMPEIYWTKKENAISELHPDWTMEQICKELEKLRESFSKQITEVLSGKRNVGKFISTIDVIDDNGQTQSVSIEPIKMNLEEYISAQVDISKIADSATTSGLGLHPALSNIIINGQLNSGSQLIYALKLFLATDTAIAEDIIFEPINTALEINFPGKVIKMGFYHDIVKREEDVTSSDRIQNNV